MSEPNVVVTSKDKMPGRPLNLALETIFCTLFILVSNLAQAGGLAVSPGEVLIENLRIGQSYNMTREKGIPVSVTNTSSSPIELKIEALVPTPGEKREGYEPIPDPSWLKLGQDQFSLEPKRDRSFSRVSDDS